MKTKEIIVEMLAEVEVAGLTIKCFCSPDFDINFPYPLFGRFSHLDGTVYVKSGISKDQFNITYWEEIIHAIDKLYPTQGEMPEEKIQSLAMGLYQVLKQYGMYIVSGKGRY